MKSEFFRQEAEQKLYTATDINGEPNRKELETIREFESKFKNNEVFIGLAPFGSVVSGYNNESSDIDVYLLSDDTKTDSVERGSFLREIGRITDEFPEISVMEVCINVDKIITDIENYFAGHIKILPEIQLAAMSRIITGKKINKYRNTIVNQLHELTFEQQEKITEKIADFLAASDALSMTKRKDRLPDLSEENHQEIIEKRREMWLKRVKKVWGLNN